MKKSLVICGFLLVLCLSLVSAHQYIVDEDFGDIIFSEWGIEEGVTADEVDFAATLFSNFENGASARYIVQNTLYNEDVRVMIAEFQNDISFEDFENNYVNLFVQEGSDIDYDPANVGESLSGAQFFMASTITGRNNDISSVTYSWVSYGKFILISVADFRSIDGILETDFNNFLTSYMEKHPSTLVKEPSSLVCVDSDGGLKYFEKGELIVEGNVYEDVCVDLNFVKEYFCDNPPIYYDNFYCENGCNEGACIREDNNQNENIGDIEGLIYVEEDFNEGAGCRVLDYEWRDSCVFSKSRKYDIEDYLSSKIYVIIEQYEKNFDEDDLVESVKQDLDLDDFDSSDYSVIKDGVSMFYLIRDNEKQSVLFWKSGVHIIWIYIEELPMSYSDDPLIESVLDFYLEMYPLVKEIEENIGEDEIEECNGCLLDKKCYTFGYRKAGEYCLEDNYFVSQLEVKSSCENNFECQSNLCIEGECISGGLFKRMLEWFKNFFG